MFGVLHDADVEEGGLDPLKRDRHITDSVEDNLRIQVLDEMLMETATEWKEINLTHFTH